MTPVKQRTDLSKTCIYTYIWYIWTGLYLEVELNLANLDCLQWEDGNFRNKENGISEQRPILRRKKEEKRRLQDYKFRTPKKEEADQTKNISQLQMHKSTNAKGKMQM